MFHDTQTTIARLAALRDLGVRIAVDDFGTGYSSLGYLRRFQVDILKIAREFIAPSATGPDGWAFANAIVALGRTLGLRIIAEGIEEPDQLEQLRELGCEFGQGYLFAKADAGRGDGRAPAATGRPPRPGPRTGAAAAAAAAAAACPASPPDVHPVRGRHRARPRHAPRRPGGRPRRHPDPLAGGRSSRPARPGRPVLAARSRPRRRPRPADLRRLDAAGRGRRAAQPRRCRACRSSPRARRATWPRSSPTAATCRPAPPRSRSMGGAPAALEAGYSNSSVAADPAPVVPDRRVRAAAARCRSRTCSASATC